MTSNLYGMSRQELAEALQPMAQKSFHARQLFRWIYARGETDFTKMSDLPASLRERLCGRFMVQLPRVELRESSTDGTIKYLLRLTDGKAVEAVFIPERQRITLCLSSQIGCALGCAFCLTAKMGLVRNLTPGEIAGQVSIMAGEHGLGANHYNLVFMGMGEPLHNYDNVLAAFRLLTDPEGFGIAPKHITLSTAGVVPGIRRLAGERSRPRLAVSLSSPQDAARNALMPINRAYPLAQLFEALHGLPLAPRERITLEYVLLKGVNDQVREALRLCVLAGSLPIKVNLIPYNEAKVEGFAPASLEAARRFRDLLLARGIPASVRRRRGADISAACGQLAILDSSTPALPAPAREELR
jgi:23S rRNA (adenine2503-C2)-methyltransferase